MMSSDHGSQSVSDEPENLVLQLLREMRSDFARLDADMKSEIHSLRADIASDLMTLEKRLSDQIVGCGVQALSITRRRLATAS
jgi:hypothetical protein